MKLIQDIKGQIALLGLMLLLLVIVVLGVAFNSIILTKVTPKLLNASTNATANATMNLAVSRGWNATDFAGIGLPIAIALGFIIFMVLFVRNGGQGGQPQ